VGATDFFVKTPGRWTLLSQRLRYLTRASRVREELVRNRADLLRVQRIARLGSWRWDAASRRIALSDEAFSLVEMTPQAGGVGPEQIWQRVAARDRTRIEQLLRDARPDDSTLNFECRMRVSDSEIRILRIEAELQYEAAGELVAAHGAVQDVTRDRLAADQIRQLANFRRADGPAESPSLSRDLRRGAGARPVAPHAHRCAAGRSQPVPQHQRFARNPRRRPVAPGDFASAQHRAAA